ncbi:hypothetical protein HY345_04515 [Candidatus Microgenomates bacterium]|nr:hypothetical protein [Candidatus Microgenomates bacterium]
MKKLEAFIVLCVSLVLLLLSFYPILYRYQTTPAGRLYVGTEFFTQDFAGYVSTINQGRKGEWFYKDKFTNENLPSTMLYFPYLLLGQVARILNLNALVMYHLARLGLGVLYLLLTYQITKLFFPQNSKTDSLKRIISFLLIIFTSSLPMFIGGKFSSSSLSQTTAEIQVFTRYVIQPHYLLGNILLLFLIFLVLRLISNVKKKNGNIFYFSFIAIFCLSFFRPSHSLLFILSLLIFNSYLYFTKGLTKRIFLFSVGNLFFSLPGIFYLSYLKNNFPFLPYFSYDLNSGVGVSLTDFIFSFGLNFLLVFFGLWFLFKKRKLEGKVVFLYCYLCAVVLCLFILSQIIPINSLRFIQTPTFIIVGLLSSVVIFSQLKNIYLILATCCLILAFSLPTLLIDFRHQVKLYYDAYYIWPPQKYWEGFSFLEKNSKTSDLVLTYQSLSNLVPMITGNNVFWGHTNETLNYEKKKNQVEKFYRMEMKENEAKALLSKNSVKYILVGREEKFLGWSGYKFLKKIFSNEEIEIYTY